MRKLFVIAGLLVAAAAGANIAHADTLLASKPQAAATMALPVAVSTAGSAAAPDLPVVAGVKALSDRGKADTEAEGYWTCVYYAGRTYCYYTQNRPGCTWVYYNGQSRCY